MKALVEEGHCVSFAAKSEGNARDETIFRCTPNQILIERFAAPITARCGT
jgi:hypothetical protein